VTAQLERGTTVGTTAGPRRPLGRPHLLGELLVVLCLLRVYDLARGQADLRRVAAIRHGEWILTAESWLHIDGELTANLWTTSHRLLSLVASDFYQFAHIPVTLSVLAWTWWRRPDLYRPARNALVLVNVMGLTVFLLLPVAPPRLLPGGGFVDAVANAGYGPEHGPVHADQYGALPSLHLGWAVWVTVVVLRLLAHTRARHAVWGYPVLVTTVVVVTGNHYLLDAVAGTAVALSAHALAQGPLRAMSRPWQARPLVLRAVPWSR
jgi:hypothetical protein